MSLLSKVADRIGAALGETKPASRPRFSLCHATARVPDGWQEAAAAWLKRADNPELCEYILCMDQADIERYPNERIQLNIGGVRPIRVALATNYGRQCAVDGWNTAAAAATGDILITVADDWFPPEHWDTLLSDLIQRTIDANKGSGVVTLERFAEQQAVWVATGVNDGLMTFSILTRAYYQRYGYVFYPEYIGMYADNDFQKQCERDGVLIDARKILPVFEHRHPVAGTAKDDEIYQRQNRSEAYQFGERLFKSRWQQSAFSLHETVQKQKGKRRIAVCLPGENFSKHFLRAWGEILAFLLMKRNFIVTPIYGHCSNVYISRQSMANTIDMLPDPHKYVLWIDDDQIVSPQDVEYLIETLEKYPGVDVVSGWTYIQDEMTGTTKVSAGKYSDDDSTVCCIPIAEMHRVAKDGLPIDVEWTGFPVVLMRTSVITKANNAGRDRYMRIIKALEIAYGETADSKVGIEKLGFAPIFTPASMFGFSGEDIAFCINSKNAGAKILVDSRVYVPHLKLRAIGPVLSVEEKTRMAGTNIFASPLRGPGIGLDRALENDGIPDEVFEDGLRNGRRMAYTGV